MNISNIVRRKPQVRDESKNSNDKSHKFRFDLLLPFSSISKNGRSAQHWRRKPSSSTILQAVKKWRERARTGRDGVEEVTASFNRLSRSLSITIQPLYYYFFPGWECLSRIMRSVKYCHADTSRPTTRLETLSSPSLFVEHNACTLKRVFDACVL